MKFLCLGYYNEKKFAAMPKDDVDALVRKCRTHDEGLRNSGHLLLVASLAATRDTTSVRPKNGVPSVTDGPFAETKEQIGAFFIIEAADLAEAIAHRIAAPGRAPRRRRGLGHRGAAHRLLPAAAGPRAPLPQYVRAGGPGRTRPIMAGNLRRRNEMRFMIMVRATKDSEAASSRTRSFWPRWASSTRSSSRPASCWPAKGSSRAPRARACRFSGTKRTVIDGPFAETKELIAGFWIWKVKSKEEAIEWVKRCPNPFPTDSEIEIRQVFEAEDFGAEFTPELKAQEERLRATVAARK